MIVAALSAQTGECVNCNNAPPPGPFGESTYKSRVGFNNVADGDYSFAGGENSFAGGLRSFAFGSSVQATGINSVAFGQGTTSTGLSSFAFGIGAQSVGDGTFALGSFVKARYSTSFAIGSGTSKYFLESTESETMVIGFNSKNPTLFISRSPNSDEPYELTGMVGIGNVRRPMAKLHIRADKDERTALLLEPFEWKEDTNAIVVFGNAEHTISSHGTIGMLFRAPREKHFVFQGAKLGIGDSKHTIFSDEQLGMIFETEDEKGFVFLNGNVGIGTHSPIAKLDIDGTVRIAPFAVEPGQHKIIFADEEGFLFTDNIPLYDNLGNHTAEQDIITNGNWIKHSESEESEGIFISDANKVGIGTSMPLAMLDVRSAGETGIIAMSSQAQNSGFWAANSIFAYGFGVDSEGVGHISANMNSPVNIINFFSNGKIAIGNATPLVGTSHRLFVEGGITSEEVVINSLNENREWPDYVLKEGYDLLPLTDLKDFINVNGHLPNVVTADDVNQKGQNLGEINIMLLEKIEELTLYLLKQQEEIDELKKSVKNE